LKIYLLITVSLIVPVLLCCIVLFSTTSSTIKNYTFNDNGALLQSNVSNVESKFNVLDSASTSLLLNLVRIPEVVADGKRTSVSVYSATEYAFKVQKSLITETYTITGLRPYYLYFPRRQSLIVSGMTFFDNIKYNDLDSMYIPEGKWEVSTPYDQLLSNPLVGKYMAERNFSKNYITKNNTNQDIILTANVSEQYVHEQFTANMRYKPSYAMILDVNGKVLSSADKNEIDESVPHFHHILSAVKNSRSNRDYLEVEIGDKSYMVNWEYSQMHQWYYITALDTEIVTSSIASILTVMYIMIVVLVFISLAITILLARSMMKPFNVLTAAMSEIKNRNFKVKIDKEYGDEFDVIYHGFNEMSAEIDDLVQSIGEQKNLKTETHIRLLQSEINPHMLYNSLESLYSMAKINKQEEMATLVMAMSKFFRISLSGGKRVVPFRDAFELAYQYIIVQNIRLNYIIKFEWDIPDRVMNLLTPKFLLQPIVENAFQHGFRNKRDNCKLSIRAIEENDNVRIIVRDNGIGIHLSDLAALNEMINTFDFDRKASNKGYALRNINYQLKLKYGENYGIKVESVYGEYTQVLIDIPYAAEEDDNVQYPDR
jgi:sensor histidine kinase YesM